MGQLGDVFGVGALAVEEVSLVHKFGYFAFSRTALPGCTRDQVIANWRSRDHNNWDLILYAQLHLVVDVETWITQKNAHYLASGDAWSFLFTLSYFHAEVDFEWGFSSPSKVLLRVVQKEKMGVSIGEFHGINLWGVDLWEFNLSLWPNSYQFYASSQGELLNSWGKSIVNDHCICIEGGSGYSREELSSSFLHGSNQVNDWCSFGVFKLFQHFLNWKALFVDVVDFYELGQLSSRE